MNIDKSLRQNKKQLLAYFRDRGGESLAEIRQNYGTTQFKEQASAINKALGEAKENLINTLMQKAQLEKWSNQEKLESVLIVTYCNYIVMLEYRNEV